MILGSTSFKKMFSARYFLNASENGFGVLGEPFYIPGHQSHTLTNKMQWQQLFLYARPSEVVKGREGEREREGRREGENQTLCPKVLIHHQEAKMSQLTIRRHHVVFISFHFYQNTGFLIFSFYCYPFLFYRFYILTKILTFICSALKVSLQYEWTAEFLWPEVWYSKVLSSSFILITQFE